MDAPVAGLPLGAWRSQVHLCLPDISKSYFALFLSKNHAFNLALHILCSSKRFTKDYLWLRTELNVLQSK